MLLHVYKKMQTISPLKPFVKIENDLSEMVTVEVTLHKSSYIRGLVKNN